MQARWAEELQTYNFDLCYWKGSSNQKGDTFSRCPAFTSKEVGTTAAEHKTLLRNEQWLEVEAMHLHVEEVKVIRIEVLGVKQLLLDAKECIKTKALLDDDYVAICKQLNSGGNVDQNYEIRNDSLCWNNRVYAPKGLRKSIMKSGHDSKVAGHFGPE
jgi:hypothetical protein